MAAQNGHLEVCKLLLDHEADVNKADEVSTVVVVGVAVSAFHMHCLS
jgi:Ankyrin repeat